MMTLLRSAGACLLVLALSCQCSAQPGPTKKDGKGPDVKDKAALDKALAAARAAAKAGQHEAALKAFDAALKLSPADKGIQGERAAVAKALEAATAATRKVAYDQAMAQARALRASGRMAEAAKQYEAALAARPKDAEAAKELAVVWAAVKAVHDAEAERKERTYQTAVENGLVQLAERRHTEAQASFSLALAQKPGDEAAEAGRKLAEEGVRQDTLARALAMARAHLAGGRYPAALASFDEAIKLAPGNKAIQTERAAAAKTRDMAAEAAAKAEYTRAMTQARALMKARRFAEAAENLRAALAARPKDAEAAKELEAATKAHNDFIAEEAKKDQAYQAALKRGLAQIGQKKYADAVKSFDEALKHRPAGQGALSGKKLAQVGVNTAATPAPKGGR